MLAIAGIFGVVLLFIFMATYATFFIPILICIGVFVIVYAFIYTLIDD